MSLYTHPSNLHGRGKVSLVRGKVSLVRGLLKLVLVREYMYFTSRRTRHVLAYSSAKTINKAISIYLSIYIYMAIIMNNDHTYSSAREQERGISMDVDLFLSVRLQPCKDRDEIYELPFHGLPVKLHGCITHRSIGLSEGRSNATSSDLHACMHEAM
jgi:hypothetical protein